LVAPVLVGLKDRSDVISSAAGFNAEVERALLSGDHEFASQLNAPRPPHQDIRIYQASRATRYPRRTCVSPVAVVAGSVWEGRRQE